MPIWTVVLLLEIINFLLGLFLKNYLPSYMDEKGKNLATKEDIKEITQLTEEVQQDFRKELERFNSDLHFKYDFYYKQYEGLYSYLYAIIIQSEYVRDYLKRINKQEVSIEEVPFITISPINRLTQKFEFNAGEPTKFTTSSEKIETPISQSNFDQLVEYIIANSALADQELMKYTVSYRFAHQVVHAKDQPQEADVEETRLQEAIIRSIIKTYNRLKKELKMEFNNKELESGSLEVL